MSHAASRQTDLFATTASLDVPMPIDPATMEARARARLLGWLAEARAAAVPPWSPQESSVKAILFPQMANWLPAEERGPLVKAFRAELARLGVGDRCGG